MALLPAGGKAAVNPLRPAKAEFHHRITPRSLANPRGLGGNQRLKINEIQQQRFKQLAERSGKTVTIRLERGTDIDAACGQLHNKFVEAQK